MKLMTRDQIQEEAVYISLGANVLGKGMSQSVLPHSNG